MLMGITLYEQKTFYFQPVKVALGCLTFGIAIFYRFYSLPTILFLCHCMEYIIKPFDETSEI